MDDAEPPQAPRLTQRQKTLTWDKLLAEQPFPGWDGALPADFVAASRERMRAAIVALQALGLQPGEDQVRAILKACVEWFNAKDMEAEDPVITTIEREDICELLADLALVARHPGLADEVDEWRDW